ncbi:Phosphatidylinositol N-acetylglucosaminyltransferase GPI2 subunit-like protein [Emericellopsis cladophorae]|uniref:Phosphatidylinositol N-acetylglucosaminyltransferase GPI2 subunit-like protein n=1 Tax=Emericellopsis cladophorae TaxID=2686198 RepID=A0A9P9XWJ1_9HYPO|nr:Phosphatidylinositol N-acetylglucosaminyltransferase GPI2 subunit-like protein [Emericellopsis cladophorae]KAI6778928.1 Phosphatidylinositol N-acetylglucosaminyltransferase GPI2 subunit-like protein [Emericellopsis cladophorae]
MKPRNSVGSSPLASPKNSLEDWENRLIGKTLHATDTGPTTFCIKDLPGERRIIKPNDATTEDYIEERLNVTHHHHHHQHNEKDALTAMPSHTDDDESETPFPTLDLHVSSRLASGLLSPDDAFPPPHRAPYAGDSASELGRPRLRRLHSDQGGSRRRKRSWKKLMWVKQSYPDNYTDQATFLGDLQRNPRLKPYDFWPLVADSTVILQHVCSVIIFVVCFAFIFQDRVSPVSIVSWSSGATVAGWFVWEYWVSREDQNEDPSSLGTSVATVVVGRSGSLNRRRTRAASIRRQTPLRSESTARYPPSGLSAPPTKLSLTDVSANSSTSNLSSAGRPPPTTVSTPSLRTRLSHEMLSSPSETIPPFNPGEINHFHERLGTLKSSALIYSTLLGLSPILKSLTRSTSSDSIWAMSFWLLVINIFFFDYSGGVGAKFPASLSTNAALMASTVLASRLPSTTQVFSLTLFSIEVFGLFPVFRRHVRHQSWQLNVALTILLVLGAGLGVGLVVRQREDGGWNWTSGIVGMVISVLLAVVGTGGCSWWLIGLQKYKNEIRGPWDPARPIIMNRQRWDDK